MVVKFLKDHDMSENFESQYIAVSNLPYPGHVYSIAGLQISWKNVSGTQNGVIKLLASYDKESNSYLKTFSVDSKSNENDALFVVCLPYFEYLKLIYEKNDIESGLLNISISYNETKG